MGGWSGCGRLSRSALISSLDSVSGSPGTMADVAVVVVVVLVQILPDDALAGPLCVSITGVHTVDNQEWIKRRN